MGLHERVAAAADGELPEWSQVGDARLAHIARVASLMATWAARRGLSATDQARWLAAAYLHDALRETPVDVLRSLVPEELRDLPAGALHGPATAERLRAEGVADLSLLRAVAYHTLGHPELDDLGRALYVADFLEPGRPFLPALREALRSRMPGELDAVAREVAGARIRHLIERDVPLRPETVGFWNVLTAEPSRVGAP